MRAKPLRERVCPLCRRLVKTRSNGTFVKHSSVWATPPPGAPMCSGSGMSGRPTYEGLMKALDAHWTEADRRQARQEAFDTGACPNGPEEDGTWPCDPIVNFGGGWAQCSVCGREGKWPSEASERSGTWTHRSWWPFSRRVWVDAWNDYRFRVIVGVEIVGLLIVVLIGWLA